MRRVGKQTFQLGWLDFSLSALASCLAVFSVGMGLKVPEISWFFTGWIAVGTVASFILCRLIPEKHTWVSGLVYSMASIGSVAYVQTLNSWLPKGGFPVQLIIAASLAWMLLFGSFLTWRDSTIVFQAVPSIALFGLVGAWDTFAGAPFAFFGFLLCFATLFARAHGRMMMIQAEESGYSAIAAKSTADRSMASAYETLKKGPWRWMAGPEWALGSAAVIVLLSVLGAPVLQSSVQGVAGFVSFQVPQVAPGTASATNAAFVPNTLGNVNVGQGPRRNLRKRPVFTARLTDLDGDSGLTKKPTYFRLRTYGTYTGRGWAPVSDFPGRNLMIQAMEDDASFMNRVRSEIDPYVRLQFDIELLGSMSDGVPVPGDVEYLQSSQFFARRPDGTIRQGGGNFQSAVGGIVRVPKPDSAPSKSKPIESTYSEDTERRIPDRVRSLAQAVVGGAKDDYEKAERIKDEIGRRVVYSLDSPPVPAGSDPVEWFLFDGRIGYCDLFASAMTVMARSVGLPARYVTGYYPALGQRDNSGRMVLHESEAHAWCEIYFEGSGWVAFDATEGAIDVGTPTAEVPIYEQDWFKAAMFTMGGLIVVGTPVAISVIVRRRRGPKDAVKRALAQHYNRFVAALEKRTGKPKRPSQTPREYMETVHELLNHGHAEAEAVTKRFESVLYSPSGINAADLGSLRDEVAAAVRALSRK